MQRCPVDHSRLSERKTLRQENTAGAGAIERDAAGTWHIRSYDAARTILRGAGTRQAGFGADLMDAMPQTLQTRPPILFQEGKEHQLQRKQTARFFTPRAVSEQYHGLMERLSDATTADLRRAKRADLSRISLRMAVSVAAQVIGLTDSRLPGMDRRLSAFLSGDLPQPGRSPRSIYRFLATQKRVMAFFLLDVRPAIAARRRAPGPDVISHLLEQGYRDSEILTECITFAAAGMATTREFICVAAWHLLERPALRDAFLAADAAGQQQMLHEMLRLEPVVSHLYRRATADIELESEGRRVTIAAGDLIDIHIYEVNADSAVVGQDPLRFCPGRALSDERAWPSLMSFGDGHHRCPGASIALQETTILLQRLLSLPGLRILQPPAVCWNELSKGYELRNFIVGLS